MNKTCKLLRVELAHRELVILHHQEVKLVKTEFLVGQKIVVAVRVLIFLPMGINHMKLFTILKKNNEH